MKAGVTTGAIPQASATPVTSATSGGAASLNISLGNAGQTALIYTITPNDYAGSTETVPIAYNGPDDDHLARRRRRLLRRDLHGQHHRRLHPSLRGTRPVTARRTGTGSRRPSRWDPVASRDHTDAVIGRLTCYRPLDSAAMRLMLLRHGQTPHNVAGALDTGRPGAGLTALGHAQARALPAAFGGQKISAMYASVLVRSQLTAAPLAEARGLTVGVEEGIEEIVAGDLELHSGKESISAYLDVVSSWIRGDLGRAMPGGQTGRVFVDRYDAAIANVAAAHADQDAVLVVSHGAAIRAWVGIRVRGVGSVEDLWLANTGMVLLEGGLSTGWALVRWQSEPMGAAALPDVVAHDVTGAPVLEAVSETREAG